MNSVDKILDTNVVDVDIGDVDIGDVDIGDVDIGDVDIGDVDIGDVDIGDVDGDGDIDEGDNKTDGGNILLANIIYIFHIFVVLFVVLTPFVFYNTSQLLVLHITFTISLLLHWWGNSNVCSLSYMESKLRGLDYTESFTHKFIAPIYDISQTTWSKICYIITIVVLSLSLYHVYHVKDWKHSWECFKNKCNDIYTQPEYQQLSFLQRMSLYFECLHIILF
jgi:hypothetical protein